MREVRVEEITRAVKELFLKANYELPPDVEKAYREALKREESEAGKEVLNLILLNAEVARRERVAYCQDTGVAVVFVQIGQDVRIVGGDLNEAIIEADSFDLIVMGQPEGPGCYCAAHSFLSQALEKLLRHYAYTIVDNEAGMEHLSRLNMRQVDHLLVVSDASSRGVLTASRIAALIKPLQLEVDHVWLLVNRAPQQIPQALDDYVKEICAQSGLNFLGYLPESAEIFEREVKREPLLDLPSDVPVVKQAYAHFEKMLKGG